MGFLVVSALLTGMMLIRSQVSNWKFSKQHARPNMACQVVIYKFVFDDFLSAMRCMKPTYEPTAALIRGVLTHRISTKLFITEIQDKKRELVFLLTPQV